MKTIEIPFEMIDQIVVDELKEALTLNVTITRQEDGHVAEPDLELINALKIVLRYFAPKSEYEPFLRNIALSEMVMHSELLGLYDEIEQPDPVEERKGS